MMTIFGIIFVVGVFGIFLAVILNTGSSPTTKQTQNEPTELDAELEAHIESFEGHTFN